VAPCDVRLPSGKEADEDSDTVVQPDTAVICNGTTAAKSAGDGPVSPAIAAP